MNTVTARAEAFAALHESGCFVIPNPWDVGSARMLAALGAKALALCVLLLCLAYLLFVRLRTCYAWRVASRNGRGGRAVD